MALQSNPPPLPHNALIEHRDLPKPGVRMSELRVVVSGDRFLAEGIMQSPAPLCYYPIYSNPEEAFSALREGRTAGVIFDLGGWAGSLITLIDSVRKLHQQRPEMQVVFMTSEEESAMLNFLQASCRASVLNKRQELEKIRAMLQSAPGPFVASEQIFSQKQWNILLLMSQGYSLRTIALRQAQPYHRVVYLTGRILALLRLASRQQLMRLLQRVSASQG